MSQTYDDRPFYQRIGFNPGSRPVTMKRESPANAPARILAPSLDTEVAALNAQQGRNHVEKAIKLLASRDSSFAALGYRDQCFRAGEYVQRLLVGNAPAAAAPPAGTDDMGKLVAAVNAQPGRNAVERANALLCSRNASHKALPYAEQCRVAGEFTRELLAGRMPVLP